MLKMDCVKVHAQDLTHILYLVKYVVHLVPIILVVHQDTV